MNFMQYAAILFTLLSGISASCNNWVFRLQSTKNTAARDLKVYLATFYFSSLVLSFGLYPRATTGAISGSMLFLGGIVGILNASLMTLTAIALQRGPSSLTYAMQNASAAFPGLVLFLLLGVEFGYTLSWSQLAGMGLIVMGLFAGTRKSDEAAAGFSFRWLKYALGVFLIQIITLSLIQGRCLLYNESVCQWLQIAPATPDDDAWFLIGQFGAAFVLQLFLLLKQGGGGFSFSPIKLGISAGLLYFLSCVFLLLGTASAKPTEQAIIFPLFAVTTIFLCNGWSAYLYKERFNIPSFLLCSLGILLALI